MDTSNTAGFKNVNSAVGTTEYQYNSDTNKGITNIDYNYLNLPEQVTLNNGDIIQYTYDAAGMKHAKTVDDGSPETTAYVGGFHYLNGDLKFLQHAEGRALKSGTTWNYEYNLTDHLGNVRVSVNSSGDVVQRDGFYPFGLTFNSYTSGTENLYKYNGFEEQKETGWYDYLARQYDPELGRFTSIDPAADLMRRQGPYNYAFNNPIRFIDPDGMIPEDEVKSRELEEYGTESRVITNTYNDGGSIKNSSNTITETHSTSTGRFSQDDEGNDIFIETTKTVTTTSTLDFKGEVVDDSQTLSTSEVISSVDEAIQSTGLTSSEKIKVKGDVVSSSKTQATSSEFSPSQEFSQLATVPSEYSRYHQGSSVNHADATYFLNQRAGSPDYGDRVNGLTTMIGMALYATSSTSKVYYQSKVDSFGKEYSKGNRIPKKVKEMWKIRGPLDN